MSSYPTESESIVSCHCGEPGDGAPSSCACRSSAGNTKKKPPQKSWKNTVDAAYMKTKKKKKCPEECPPNVEKKKRRFVPHPDRFHPGICGSPRKSHRHRHKPFPLIKLMWPVIWNMIISSYIMNGFHLIYGIFLIILGIRLLENSADFINLVTCVDGTYIAYFILIAGISSIPVNLGFFLITWKSLKKCRDSAINSIHFFLIIVAAILVILLILFSIYVFVHTMSALRDRKQHGILSAMKKYKTDLREKIIIDRLQLQFQCCGHKKYNEWFDIAWYDNSMTTRKASNDCQEILPSTRDDAPFSCCSRSSSFPCIHHSMMAVGSAYLYAPETNMSVSEHGCQSILLHWTKGFTWRTATLLLLLAILQAAVTVLQRLLQTAHQENLRFEKTCYEHTAWVFGSQGGSKKCGPRPPPVPDDW